jgi:hypothetical protein
MADQVDAVESNLAAFAEYATSLNQDYQLGAVTGAYVAVATCPGGESSAPGVLHAAFGNPRIVAKSPPDPATPPYLPIATDPAAAFAQNAAPGVCTIDGGEGCLEALRLALTDPRLSDPGANSGFLREYAKLVVIIVTDGDDHSPGTVEEYAEFLWQLKGPRNGPLLALSVVAPFDRDGDVKDPPKAQACASDPGSEPPARYLDLHERIGNGIAASICGDDWGQHLMMLGMDEWSVVVEYFLSHQPDPSTIVVMVNGVVVHEDPAAGYTYDPNTNSIIFGSGAVPPHGATIEVTYRVQCY